MSCPLLRQPKIAWPSGVMPPPRMPDWPCAPNGPPVSVSTTAAMHCWPAGQSVAVLQPVVVVVAQCPATGSTTDPDVPVVVQCGPTSTALSRTSNGRSNALVAVAPVNVHAAITALPGGSSAPYARNLNVWNTPSLFDHVTPVGSVVTSTFGPNIARLVLFVTARLTVSVVPASVAVPVKSMFGAGDVTVTVPAAASTCSVPVCAGSATIAKSAVAGP